MSTDVVIIGAGPTGLTAASLLARYGVNCVVLDRWPSIYPQPRAVHLDDEVYRILARIGVADEFAAISRPGRGLRLLDPRRRVLAEFRRGTEPGRHGFPAANMFDQPDLEGVLRANLKQLRNVELIGGVEVTAIDQDEDEDQDDAAVNVRYTITTTGETTAIRARYLLGCDGANSITRTTIGSFMRDLNFAQRWLVVDIATEADPGHWEGVHQVCDPTGAATFMRIGDARYRWEFQLSPGRSADDYRDLDQLRPLIAPWTMHVPDEHLNLIRVADYTFRAQIADRWRDRRIFLLGDAAHLTPPFIGQGMGAGLRDAMNLTWKLAAVIGGSLPESVLETYETERKPHARAMIRLAKLVGTAMTRGGRPGNALRALIAPRLRHVPGINGLILSSKTPALRRSELVIKPRFPGNLPGSLVPATLLPDAPDARFTLVTNLHPSSQQHAVAGQRGIVVHTARPGTPLSRWLRSGRTHAALVRPDGTVMCTGRDIEEVINALP
ncbi:MAG TPA: bifunctional 3-(3-hydroxy-phenyl)propionate/3-hydroxycinnamic acid hydroxylase [Actinospica sp.]|jgi:3-(3-hydroxy-phenyl)propionate hydroxylase|nr:bifunctional 3-(3-hydroxy-phenyl)propionate/3-hydroxycinnamic acid hydroxylase [Actinospica sp.]